MQVDKIWLDSSQENELRLHQLLTYVRVTNWVSVYSIYVRVVLKAETMTFLGLLS